MGAVGLVLSGLWANRLSLLPWTVALPPAVWFWQANPLELSHPDRTTVCLLLWSVLSVAASRAWLTDDRQRRLARSRMLWKTRTRWRTAACDAGLVNRVGEPPRLEALAAGPTAVHGQVRLPTGLAVSDLELALERLASGLRASNVAAYRDPADASMAEIVIRFGEPLADVVPWSIEPMLDHHVGVGVDADGRTVRVTLLGQSMLVGGSTGAGKSGLLQILVGSAVATPNWRVALVDPKRVEMSMWRPYVEHFAAELDDVVVLLDRLLEEMDRRYRQMEAEGRRLVDVDDRSTPPVLLVIDELAELTAHADKKLASSIEDRLRRYLSLGRAAGMSAVLATQRPSHDVVATSVRDLVPQRVALSCATSAQSDTILGAGWAASGFDGARLPRNQPGTALLLTGNDEPRMIRVGYIPDSGLPGGESEGGNRGRG